VIGTFFIAFSLVIGTFFTAFIAAMIPSHAQVARVEGENVSEKALPFDFEPHFISFHQRQQVRERATWIERPFSS